MDYNQINPGISGDTSSHQALGTLNKLFYEGYIISRAIHVAACLGIADVLKDGPLTEAGFHRIQNIFQNFMMGGWIAFKA